MRRNVRPLRQSDLEYFDTFGKSVIGITGTINDEPVMFAGVLLDEPLQAFSVLLDSGAKEKRLMVEMIREYKNLISNIDAPIYAVAEGYGDNPARVCEGAGFKKVRRELYVIGGV